MFPQRRSLARPRWRILWLLIGPDRGVIARDFSARKSCAMIGLTFIYPRNPMSAYAFKATETWARSTHFQS